MTSSIRTALRPYMDTAAAKSAPFELRDWVAKGPLFALADLPIELFRGWALTGLGGYPCTASFISSA